MDSEITPRGLSPQPTSLTKTTSYSKSITPLIREGSVAARISQIHAKLSPDKDSRPASPTRTPIRTAPGALSRFSISKLMLSPKDVPLPETPAHVLNQYPRQKPASKVPSFANLEDMITDAIASLDVAEAYSSTEHESEDSASSEYNEDARNSSAAESVFADDVSQQEDTNMSLLTPIKQGIMARYSTPGATSTPKQYISPRFTENLRVTTGSSSRIPRPINEITGTNTAYHEVENPIEPIKKTASASPGGAYSKILPFMLSPSVYLPRRQSQLIEPAEGLPPPDTTAYGSALANDVEGSPPSTLSPTGRRRSERSLRRRTFHAKSYDTLRADSAADQSPTRKPSNRLAGPVEDVFTERPRTPKAYQVEPALVADNITIASLQSLHDIKNPEYKPSVMPRRLDSRHMARNRHGRSSSSIAGESQSSNIRSDNTRSHNYSKSGSGEASIEMSTSKDALHETDAELQSQVSGPNSRDVSTSWRKVHRSSSSRHRIFEERDTQESHIHQPQADRKHGGLNTGDGNYSSSESESSITIDDSAISASAAVSSSSRQVSQSVPKPVFQDVPELRASPGVLSNVQVHTISNSTEKGLKLIVTVDKDIDQVIKIEVHPASQSRSLYHDGNKENILE